MDVLKPLKTSNSESKVVRQNPIVFALNCYPG